MLSRTRCASTECFAAALLVYIETVPKLRANPGGIDAGALAQTAKLFRSFGEDYHEKKLEEAHIFPVLRKAGGPAAGYVDVLIAQHNRGREVTDYILGKGAPVEACEIVQLFWLGVHLGHCKTKWSIRMS